MVFWDYLLIIICQIICRVIWDYLSDYMSDYLWSFVRLFSGYLQVIEFIWRLFDGFLRLFSYYFWIISGLFVGLFVWLFADYLRLFVGLFVGYLRLFVWLLSGYLQVILVYLQIICWLFEIICWLFLNYFWVIRRLFADYLRIICRLFEIICALRRPGGDACLAEVESLTVALSDRDSVPGQAVSLPVSLTPRRLPGRRRWILIWQLGWAYPAAMTRPPASEAGGTVDPGRHHHHDHDDGDWPGSLACLCIARMIISDHRVLVRLSHCAAATVISPRLIQQLQVRALLVLVTWGLPCCAPSCSRAQTWWLSVCHWDSWSNLIPKLTQNINQSEKWDRVVSYLL